MTAPRREPVDPKHGKWGRYLVTVDGQPTFAKYTRATTVAGTLEDKSNLMPWESTMVAQGILASAALRGEWEELISACHPDSPWYHSPESKDLAKALVEKAKERGGGNERSRLGTVLHGLTHQLDRGEEVQVTDPVMRADLDAYVAARDALGIRYHKASIEACVVLDSHKVAGQSDRLLCKLADSALPFVADLKTGRDIDYGSQSIAMQLALYAHAEAVYRFGEAEDGSEDERVDMPAVDQERAMVIHLPYGEARCEFRWVDITEGWRDVQVALRQRKRRYLRFISEPLRPPVISSAVVATPPAPTSEPVIERPGDAPGSGDSRQQALRERCRVVSEHGGGDLLKTAWPAGVDLRQPVHSVETLDLVEALVAAVEAKVLPFDPPPRPDVELADGDRKALRERFARLPVDLANAVLASAKAKDLRTPSHPTFRTVDVEPLELLLVAAEEEHAQRRQECAEALSGLDDQTVAGVLAAVGLDDGAPVDETTRDRILALAGAVGVGLVELVPGMPLLHAPDCIDRLIERFGGRRELLAAAKTFADELGVTRPGSSAEIATNPLLVAVLAAQHQPQGVSA